MTSDNFPDRSITILVAASENGVIGARGQLPWHLSTDLRRFKKLTMGHCLIMGRKTYDSIGRPLPGRQTIVLTRNESWHPPGITVVASAHQAIAEVPSDKQAFVVGGAEIYRQFLPVADRILLTRVLATIEGDVHFFVPESGWKMVAADPMPRSAADQFDCIYQTWVRQP